MKTLLCSLILLFVFAVGCYADDDYKEFNGKKAWQQLSNVADKLYDVIDARKLYKYGIISKEELHHEWIKRNAEKIKYLKEGAVLISDISQSIEVIGILKEKSDAVGVAMQTGDVSALKAYYDVQIQIEERRSYIKQAMMRLGSLMKCREEFDVNEDNRKGQTVKERDISQVES